MIRIEGSAAGAAVLTLAWTIAGAASAAEPVWRGDLVVQRAINCGTVGPIGQEGTRFTATLNPKLAPAEATLSLVLASPDQTIALRRDRDDGSIFGKATQIDADGRVRTAPVLFFLNGFDKLKPDTVFAAGTGILYDYGRRGCNIGFAAALVRG